VACGRQPSAGDGWRFWLAAALSVMLHLLFLWVFLHRQEKSSLLEAKKVEEGIEVTLTTLPAAKPAPLAQPPRPSPAAPLPPPPKPLPPVKLAAKPKPKPAPKPKPPEMPRPKPPERPRPKPPEKTVEPRPVKPPRRPKPAAKEEPVPEFKDDFQQLSNTYSHDEPAASDAAPAPASRAKPDTGVHPGAILNINPRIYYPLNAVRKGQRGVVVVLIHISRDGHTSDVDLIQSSGYDELDNQVLGAVQHWRFAAPTRGGMPVESTYKHTVIFGADEEVIDDFATNWQRIKLLPAGR